MPQKLSSVSRRSFLAAGAASAAALSLPVTAARARRTSSHAPTAPPVRNLIFLVSDGMSTGTLTLADLMLRERDGRPSRWCDLFAQEGARRSMVRTHSANSMVTDSAAASTAWGIGEAVDNGAIGFTPDRRLPEPILHQAKRAGKATGLVTTATLSHATPAGWACNIPTGRGDEASIARQMMERGYDVLMGGGRRFFTDETMALGADYTKVFTRDELLAVPANQPGRIVGSFSRGQMSYELDRTGDEPHIAEMARVALDRLSRHPDGFVLQIEGGRIDHAAHINDAGALVHEQIAFDRALGVALDFAAGRDDTLVITTTDHGNANPGLTEYTRTGRAGFLRLAEWKHSFEWMNRQLEQTEKTPEDHRRVIAQATGIELEDQELATVMRWRSGESVIPFRGLDKDHGPLGSVLANYNSVSFISGNHTADHVEQTAVGPGADTIPPVLHLADMHAIMVRLLDLPPALPSV
jgi:alkaline phosphatase